MRLGEPVRLVNPAADDDAPIFDGVALFEEAPPVAVEFAPRALRSSGRDGRRVAAAWATAVVSLIGIGLLTSVPDGADRPPGRVVEAARPASSGDPWPSALDLPSTRMGARLLRQVIEIESPAHGREVRTRQVDISGSMLERADHVGIALEARGNRVLDHVWVDVFDPDGGIRPDRTPTFAAAFDLPFPRPNGTMWVVVTAYDDRGMPLGSTRRPFTAGPLGQGGFVPRGVSLDGNWPWGPYYEPPVVEVAAVAAPLPTCQPISTTLASRC